MYLDIVLVDIITPNGVLNSYKIRPKDQARGVAVDRMWDIFPEKFSKNDLDVGGTRIYNASTCAIEKISARIRTFELNDISQSFSFQFEHKGIAIGSSREAHGGIYNFVLPPGWRLKEFLIVDPYDKNPSVQEKKQFRYEVYWDTQSQSQIIEMDMRSGRGSFSFIVAGKASLAINEQDKARYIDARESDWGIRKLCDNPLLDENGKNHMIDEILKKVDWFELKPNIAGIGINFNKIIEDCFRHFKSKLKKN